jgi:hypothetical protein
MLSLLVTLADTTPEDNDVVAGGAGAIVFVALIAAVVFLGFSLSKQLRKAQAAEDAGVYDHDDRTPGATSPAETTASGPASEATVADDEANGPAH